MTDRSDERRFPAFLGDDMAAGPDARAAFRLLPVPYERTVSWMGGTHLGPTRILEASPYLEFYDDEFRVEPFRAGVRTEPALLLDDLGPEEASHRIEERFGSLLDTGAWVGMLGGEHSVTPGAVRAAAARHEGLTVVHVDAHTDLRQEYHGDRYNHACAMARCVDRGVPVRAVGIRSYTREEAAWMEDHPDLHTCVHAWEMREPGWRERALDGLEGRPVYLTFDVDGLDPSVMPATGTPEPGGLDWQTAIDFLAALFERADVVAADFVELAPRPGLHHADFTVAKLVHKCLALRLRAGLPAR